ncbi:MAG: trigger factor [Gammaproteobacteria bacterium]|nr:MAG: trigger factor [Gammaproteobacteria bacterium]
MSEVRVSLESGAGLERRLRVQIPAERIEREFEARIRDAGRSADLRGFRRGKAPDRLIRSRFGDRIRQEVLQDVVQSSFSEAIVQEKLRPAGGPAIEAGPLQDGQDYSFTAVFEVYPDFTVGGLERLSVQKPDVPVHETDVDNMLERLRQQRCRWNETQRPAAVGDRLTIDFEGRLDGEPLEGARAEQLEVVIGSGRMLPDFETALIGMTPGASKSFPVRFPNDYHEEKLRDATVVFEASASIVAEPELPDLDDRFARECGAASGDISELRRLIRESLEREVASRVHAEVRRQIMEHLLAENPVELPMVLVREEAADLQSEAARRLGAGGGEGSPPLDAYFGVAERRVRLGLIMGALIREHGLKVEQVMVDNRLDELCRHYDRPDEVRTLYRQNPRLMSGIENSVMEEQAMTWLVERAQVTPKGVTLAELLAR